MPSRAARMIIHRRLRRVAIASDNDVSTVLEVAAGLCGTKLAAAEGD